MFANKRLLLVSAALKDRLAHVRASVERGKDFKELILVPRFGATNKGTSSCVKGLR